MRTEPSPARLRAATLAVVTAVLAAALPARAQQAAGEPAPAAGEGERVEPATYREPPVSIAPPPAGSAVPPAGTTAPEGVAGAPAASAGRTIRLVATTGYDYGFTELLEVGFENGSTEKLRLNGGGVLAVGAAFWPLQDGRFETRATIGVKYDSIEAQNGSVRFLAFPLEVTESWNVRPLRLSGGAVLLLGPRIRGSGFLGDADLDLKSSLGLVGQAEWVLHFKGGTGSLSFGLRYLWQRLEPKRGGGAEDASALGGVLGVTI